MRAALSVALLFLSSLACADNGRVWLSPDFYIDAPSAERGPAGVETESKDCRSAIAAKTCLVAPSSFPTGPRECLSGSERYVPVFEKLYDEFEPAMQSMFCEVRRLYVEQKLDSIAYSGILRNWRGRPAGAVLGVRQSVLDAQIPLSTLMSWKEQLVFGGEAGGYKPVPDLPEVEASARANNDTLYYVFSHEFGHILDFTRNVNGVSSCFLGLGACRASGWGAISWLSRSATRYDAVFPERERLDFYGSGPKMGRGDVASTYNGLLRTDFISLYAATSPYEDFAEALAVRNLLRRGGSYLNHTNAASGDLVFSARERFESPAFEPKRAYLESFLSGLRPVRETKALDLPVFEFRPFDARPLPFAVPVD